MRRARHAYIHSQQQEENLVGSMNLGTFFIPIIIAFFGLLLFFMFKATINEQQHVQTQAGIKAMLENKIGKVEKARLTSDRNILKNAFLGLTSLRDMVDEKFVEINELIKEVEVKKGSIDNIIESNKKQAIVVANFKSIIAEKNELLKMKEVAIALLNKKIAQGNFSHKKTLARLNDSIHKLETSTVVTQRQLNQLIALKNQNSFLNKTNDQQFTLIENLKNKQSRLEYINNLLTLSNKKYRKDNFDNSLNTRNLASKLAEEIEKNKGLIVKNEQYKFVRDRLLGFNKKLKTKITDRRGRHIASVDSSLRDEIIDKLINAFKDRTKNVDINPINGNLTLKSTRGYLFKKNSYLLTQETKNSLKNIIPIYTKILFDNEKFANKMASINIVGHSSPTYNKKFIHPNKDDPKAYAFNIKLSSLRAIKLTEFIFSREMGSFPHKMKMRNIVQSTGRGYTDSILRTVSAKETKCNLYDCQGSRRVELSFSLHHKQNNL